jgi:hypothetical protein
MSDNDQLRTEALLHARAVGAIAEFLLEMESHSGEEDPGDDVSYDADANARAILARLAHLPDPILLTSMSEMVEGERIVSAHGQMAAEACEHRIAAEAELRQLDARFVEVSKLRFAAEEERDRLKRELADARLLVIRKSEALLTIADNGMWMWDADEHRFQWRGINSYRDPRAFARREADADEPDNRGGTPS